MLLTGKQKWSREKATWPSLAAIVEAFARDVQGLPAQEEADAASSSSGKVTDVTAASAATVAMMQNAHMELNQLQPGSFFWHVIMLFFFGM